MATDWGSVPTAKLVAEEKDPDAVQVNVHTATVAKPSTSSSLLRFFLMRVGLNSISSFFLPGGADLRYLSMARLEAKP